MAKVYGVAGVPTFVGVAVGFVMAISALVPNTFATPYVADALPTRFQTAQTPAPQAASALFTNGAVLIRRTQTALPPPEEQAEKQRLEAIAAAVARQEASVVAKDVAERRADEAKQTALTQLEQFKQTLTAAQINQLATLQSQNQFAQTRLAAMSQETSRTVAQLISQTQFNANLLSNTLALQQQANQRILSPEQVATIAQQSVQDAAPQVRAIALQSLKDSQDYLRTLTRDAVQESDPAMAQALANAARNVITKDDRVVFAIRKAVNEALSQPEPLLSSAGPRTELGPDHDLVASISDTAINPSSLGVSAILGALEPAAGGASTSRTTPQLPLIKNPYASVTKARQRQDWMDLRQYRVAVHTDNLTLPEMLDSILKQAKPYTGPWQVRWKLMSDNQDLLKETFSLDAETTFEEFINYLAQYIMNDRGVKLGFALFDRERLIVISD